MRIIMRYKPQRVAQKPHSCPTLLFRSSVFAEDEMVQNPDPAPHLARGTAIQVPENPSLAKKTFWYD